jgi:hypothetical protein
MLCYRRRRCARRRTRKALNRIQRAHEHTTSTLKQSTKKEKAKKQAPASSPKPRKNEEFAKDNLALERFSHTKRSTECPFAKAAKLRVAKTLFDQISIKDQAREHAEALLWFTRRSMTARSWMVSALILTTSKLGREVQRNLESVFGGCLQLWLIWTLRERTCCK